MYVGFGSEASSEILYLNTLLDQLRVMEAERREGGNANKDPRLFPSFFPNALFLNSRMLTRVYDS